MFLLQSKNPSRQDHLFLVSCRIMPSAEEKNNSGQNVGCGIWRSGLRCECVALLTYCMILYNQQMELQQLRCVLWWHVMDVCSRSTIITYTSSPHYSFWQEPPTLRFQHALLKGFPLSVGLHAQCKDGTCGQPGPIDAQHPSGHRDWFSYMHVSQLTNKTEMQWWALLFH